MVKVQGSKASEKSQAPGPVERTVLKVPPRQHEPRDVIEISVAAKLAATLRELPEVRKDLVARVRAEIQNGTYVTEEKLEIALDKLMEELLPDL